jgi:DNA polymerase IV
MKKIIHIDMDAFFASVEQRDNPSLKGKPVIVGGRPNSRGVVAACSYEARKFGIHSAMSSQRAYQLCPKAVFLPCRFEAYKKVSEQIREIFLSYTNIVEPLSLDEAYLDVTENKMNIPSATIIASDIRKKIYEITGLTASAGVSYNKFLAKAASDYKKPDNITLITPDLADRFISELPIRKFFGVGRVTEKEMIKLGVKTGKDLKGISLADLIQNFGSRGSYYYNIVRGLDGRDVNPLRVRKSVGKERTFREDIGNVDEMIDVIREIAEDVISIIDRYNYKGKTLTLKVKYFDFKSITRSISRDLPFDTIGKVIPEIGALLSTTKADKKSVRLLGISISNFEHVNNLIKNKFIQLELPFI